VIRWRKVESSNVEAVGWPSTGEPLLLVRFKSGRTYGYAGVSRQRAVALAYRRRLWDRSVGAYINRIIKPQFRAVRLSKVGE
jgi:hypothetical protein